MIKIINIKSGKPYDIYIGRENKTYGLEKSMWANDFIIGKDGSREEVIEKHRLKINSQPELLKKLSELKDKILACWCEPDEECHGKTLKNLAESKYLNNWFSNFVAFEKPLLYQGILYWTPEHFYQAMKFEKNDIENRRLIAFLPINMVKKETRARKHLWKSNWSEERLRVMEYALRYKFQPGTEWHRKLMITKELNLELVEWNNWSDNFFGKDLESGEGENHLGKLLMKIRNEYE